jgi:hypothetical protein
MDRRGDARVTPYEVLVLILLAIILLALVVRR